MTRRRWPLLVAGALIAAIACDPGDAPTRVFFDDFESECDGGPCGWTSFLGEPSQSSWVETIHPGEHAVRLEGEAAIRRESERGATIAFSDPLNLQVAARCDPGTSIVVEVVLDVGGARRTARAPINPEADWVRAGVNRITFDESTVGGTVRTVAIRKVGSGGACEVGEIAIDEAPFDDFGC